MKVAMVANPVHAIPPRKGAAVEWWMYQVSQRLHGHERHIVCIADNERPDEEILDGIAFHRVKISRAYKRLFQKITRLDPYSYADRVARRLNRVRPDVVHTHNSAPLFLSLRERVPATHFLHMHNTVDFPALPPGTQLIVVSRYLQEWYRERHPGVQVHVVTNGVDVELFGSTGDAAPDDVRLRQIPRDKKIVLYVGRVSPEKGPLDLVLAFKDLLKSRSDVFLLVVGELRDGARSDKRARYCADVREACDMIAGHCLLTGNVDPVAIRHYYRRADLLVVPSEFQEPFCMVAIEGMATGVPVLAAKKGGVPEYLREGETGFFIADTKDHAQLAHRIGTLLDDHARLSAVANRAKTYVAGHHSWEEVCRQLLDVYRAAAK